MKPGVFDDLAGAIGATGCLAARPVSEGGCLWPAEKEAMRRAVPARRQEFAAGRGAAREALSALGLPAAAITVGGDRAPVWPGGVVGSISHAAGFAVALVARAEDSLAVGIDIEPHEPLPQDVVTTILRRDEAAPDDPLAARAVFAAKEATYKALYPLMKEIWDFGDLGIRLDRDATRFAAILHRPAGRFGAGTRLDGHLFTGQGLCLAALLLPVDGQPSAACP